MFDPNGVPLLTYAMFAEGLGDAENYGATHPAVEAQAKIGRVMIDNLPPTPGATAGTVAPRSKPQHFRPVNGADAVAVMAGGRRVPPARSAARRRPR
jgi:beta-lactamase class A